VPAGQAVQRNAPDVLEKVSAGHCEQALCPGDAAKLPGGHGLHGSMPPGPKLPAWHVARVVVVTAVHSIDPGGEVVPTGHASQADDPGKAANVSAGQLEHVLDPAMSANVPAGHGVHGSMPLSP
jgi:hypothetical protein